MKLGRNQNSRRERLTREGRHDTQGRPKAVGKMDNKLQNNFGKDLMGSEMLETPMKRGLGQILKSQESDNEGVARPRRRGEPRSRGSRRITEGNHFYLQSPDRSGNETKDCQMIQQNLPSTSPNPESLIPVG